jgi:hypothetical protein
MHKNFTYGTLEKNELVKIIEAAGTPIPSYFIDLGAGNGQVCQQASELNCFDKVFGIELIPIRLYHALLKRSPRIYYSHGNLYHGLPGFKRDTFAYLCSTCFSADLQKAISLHLQKNENIKKIASLKPLPLSSKNWKFLKRIFVQCSWDKAPCYLYQRYISE